MSRSPESKALQKSYETFMNGVDPANVVGPLFTAELLTPQERQRATQRTSTATEQLRAIFDALEKRVSTKPAHFHTLVEILRNHHEDVADKMQEIFDNLTKKSAEGQLAQPVPSRSEKPTVPLLKRFPTRTGGIIQIIQRIGTKYHDLGILLLNDDTGDITDAIEREYRHDPPTRVTEAILQKWLKGTGKKPQTWATLITVLRQVELSALAEEINQNHN